RDVVAVGRGAGSSERRSARDVVAGRAGPVAPRGSERPSAAGVPGQAGGGLWAGCRASEGERGRASQVARVKKCSVVMRFLTRATTASVNAPAGAPSVEK